MERSRKLSKLYEFTDKRAFPLSCTDTYILGHSSNNKRLSSDSRDRIVVSTSRCGRDNPGSNPGHGKVCECRRHGTAERFLFKAFFFSNSNF